MSMLTGKVALVTGGSRGIGAAVAKRLAHEGAAVAITFSATGERAAEVVAAIEAGGGRALAIRADSADAGAVKAAVAETVKVFGRLDVLVNNAAIARVGTIFDYAIEDLDQMIAVNIKGLFVATQEAVRHMREGGRIINIGSVSAKTPRPDSLPYTVTKFGLQGMTHQLTMDGRKYNVVSSIIHPGATLSSFTTRRGRTKAGSGERADDYVMAAEDVAKVAVLMAALPPEVNLYEATILPNHMRSFIGRG